MSGLTLCKDCVFKGTAKDRITSICRRSPPAVSPPQGVSGEHNHVIGAWPAIDPDNDGCGAGAEK
jgi:hypothetical protein